MPPPKGLPPGDAASRVRDSDLVGCKLVDCICATERYRVTPRQRDVLFLSLCEKCPKDMARMLQLRTGYVRVVPQSIVRKLRVTDGMHGVRMRLAEIARERENGGGVIS